VAAIGWCVFESPADFISAECADVGGQRLEE